MSGSCRTANPIYKDQHHLSNGKSVCEGILTSAHTNKHTPHLPLKHNVRRRYVVLPNKDGLTLTSTPPAPPPPSAEELRQQEALATQTVSSALAMCVMLYLCTYDPAIDSFGRCFGCADEGVAPFAVEYVKKLV